MAKKRKKKYSKAAWEELTRQVLAQKEEVKSEEPKPMEPKVEVHVHNNFSDFGEQKNSADNDLNRLLRSGPMKI